MTWPIIIVALIISDTVLKVTGIDSSNGYAAGILIGLLILSELLEGWNEGK